MVCHKYVRIACQGRGSLEEAIFLIRFCCLEHEKTCKIAVPRTKSSKMGVNVLRPWCRRNLPVKIRTLWLRLKIDMDNPPQTSIVLDDFLGETICFWFISIKHWRCVPCLKMCWQLIACFNAEHEKESLSGKVYHYPEGMVDGGDKDMFGTIRTPFIIVSTGIFCNHHRL